MKGGLHPTENRLRGGLSCMWMTASNEAPVTGGGVVLASVKGRGRCFGLQMRERAETIFSFGEGRGSEGLLVGLFA